MVLMIATAFAAFSTGQIAERINDNGVNKGLTKYLLELDSVSFSKLKERIPKELVSTALWRGYIGNWKIKKDSLFLDSVIVRNRTSDTLRFVPINIDDIYAAQRTPSGYFADWVTDTLRVVSGDVILYKHMGWESSWENEEFISVKGGLVKDRIVYENRIVNIVNDDEAGFRKVIDSLSLGFIPKRIVLQLGYRGFDENGFPTGYKVKAMRSCGDTIVDNRVVKAFEDSTVMRSLIPIYYIRGQYRAQDRIVTIPKSRDSRNDSN